MCHSIVRSRQAAVSASYLVVAHHDAVELGLVSGDGARLPHTVARDAIERSATQYRTQQANAEASARLMGGAWIVAPSGAMYWQGV